MTVPGVNSTISDTFGFPSTITQPVPGINPTLSGVFSGNPTPTSSYNYNTPTSQPQSSGGGSAANDVYNRNHQADLDREAAARSAQFTDPNTGVVYPSYDSFVGAVNNAYGDAYNTVGDIRNNLVNNKQTYLDSQTSPYEALRPDINTAYEQGVNLNQNQVNQTNQGTQSALGDARNLFNELMQGQNQRYGGSSSTGDFAQAFLGRGLQKQIGGIQGTAATNLGNLGTQLTNVTAQHSSNLQKLDLEKANALTQAQKDFQDRLGQIDQLKVGLDQNKAQMKLQALSDLRNQASQIASSFQTAQLNAGLAHQASLDALRNSIAGFQAYAGHPIDLSAVPGLSNPLGGGNIQLPQISGNGLGSVQGSTGTRRIDPNTGLPIAG